MRVLHVLIGTNDGENVANSHLGDSQKFVVFRLLEDGSYTMLNTIKNPFANEHHAHGKEEKMRNLMQIWGNVDVVLSRKMSPNFKVMAAKTTIQPVIVKAEKIKQAIALLAQNFEAIYTLSTRKKEGKPVNEIPKISPQ